jgi:hypothetical protein
MQATRFYQDGSTVGILEVVLRYDTAEQAKTALDQPGTDLALCPEPAPSEGTLEVRPPETMPEVSDGVHVARYFTPSAASEPSYYEVAAARTSNVVVVLAWAADDTPSGNPDSWAWSGDQLQTALDRGPQLIVCDIQDRDTPDLRRVAGAECCKRSWLYAGQRAVMISRISCAVADGVRPTLTPTASRASCLAGACRTSRRRSRRRGPSSCPRAR